MSSSGDWRLDVIKKCQMKCIILSICNDCYTNKNMDVIGTTLSMNMKRDFQYSLITYYSLPENPETIKLLIEHQAYAQHVDALLVLGGPGYMKYVTPIVTFHTADHEYENPIMSIYGIIERILIGQGLICGIVSRTVVINFPKGNENFEENYALARSTIPVMIEILSLANTENPCIESAIVLISLAFHAYAVKTVINIPTITALGHVMAEDIISRQSFPSAEISLKNGFALKCTRGVHKTRRICSMRQLKARDDKKLQSNECVRIESGDRIVSGADCVIEYKNTKRLPDDIYTIEILVPFHKHLNVKCIGGDISANEMVLKKGSIIQPEQMAILTRIGTTTVNVFSKPNIGIMSVVNRCSKEKLQSSLADSSNAMLNIFFTKHNLMTIDYGPIFENIQNSIERGLNESDILIICHNVLIANKVETVSILQNKFNAKIYFHGINLSPSALFAYCLVGGVKKYVFVIFGNPLSMLTICQTLIMTGIRYWMGDSLYEQMKMNVKLRIDVKLLSRPQYIRAMIHYSSTSECSIARIIDSQRDESSTEVILEIPAETREHKYIRAGTTISAIVLQ